jgi:putative oxidoreductase
MDKLLLLWNRATDILNPVGDWVALLPLRLLLAWEFWEAGVMKLGGNNWFGGIKENFPFPFNYVPVDLSWFIATWFELLGGIGLAIGLFTRFWAISLIILSVVAIFGVHWPDDWSSLSELWKGYAISNKGFGNFKLPLLFIVMLLPLFFSGPGKASVDHILSKKFAGT